MTQSTTSNRCKVISKKTVPRKLIGIPVGAFIFLMIVGLVVGASVFIKSLEATVSVSAQDYSTFSTNGWTNNADFQLSGGDSITREFIIENTASDYNINSKVTFTAFANGFSDGDCKIWLLDNNDNELAEDTAVQNDELKVTANYNEIQPGAEKQGKWKIQCSPDYNNSVNIDVTLEPSAQFSFD